MPYDHFSFPPNMEQVFPPLYTSVNENETRSFATLLFLYEPPGDRALVLLPVMFSSLTRCLYQYSRSVEEMVIRFPPEARHDTGRTRKLFDRSKHYDWHEVVADRQCLELETNHPGLPQQVSAH